MTIKQIGQIIDEDNSLKMIAQAYSEIANSKVKKIRAEAERNRMFLEEIGKVYSLVKLLAQKRHVSISKPKQMVCILITSNNHFYGTIDSDLIKFFTQQTSNLQTDRILIGNISIEHFKAVKVFENYQSLVLEQDMPTLQELLKLVNMTADYNQVFVFYSQLQSLLVQIPKILDLTKTQATYLATDEVDKIQFVFEPELPKTLAFFDSQVSHLLLEGAFLESEAARTASRFISMDHAQSQANILIKDMIKLRAYAKRNLVNNLILEAYASSLGTRKEGNGKGLY